MSAQATSTRFPGQNSVVHLNIVSVRSDHLGTPTSDFRAEIAVSTPNSRLRIASRVLNADSESTQHLESYRVLLVIFGLLCADLRFGFGSVGSKSETEPQVRTKNSEYDPKHLI